MFSNKRHLLLIAAVLIVVIAATSISIRRVEAARSIVTPCRHYDPAKEDPPFCAADGRVNPYDPTATMTAYCEADHSLTVMAIINREGLWLYNIGAEQIARSLAAAHTTGKNLVIEDKMQRQVWALSSSELQLHDYSGPGYDFRFAGNLCGLVPLTDNATSGGTPRDGSPTPGGFSRTIVTSGRLNIRSIPSLNGRLLGSIPRRATIYVSGRDATGYWVKISYNGITGWVSSVYAGLTKSDLRRLPILEG